MVVDTTISRRTAADQGFFGRGSACPRDRDTYLLFHQNFNANKLNCSGHPPDPPYIRQRLTQKMVHQFDWP